MKNSSMMKYLLDRKAELVKHLHEHIENEKWYSASLAAQALSTHQSRINQQIRLEGESK
jgi:hypothetical protein